MTSIRSHLLALALALFPTLHAAEMPAALKGSWILDAAKTEANIKASPKWKPGDEKMLPTIFKHMAQVLYSFNDEQVAASRRGKEMSIPIEKVESDADKHVISCQVQDKPMTITVTFVDKDTINIRSSMTNDMDYFLWKRGSLEGTDGPSDAALATEAAAKALEKKAEPSE